MSSFAFTDIRFIQSAASNRQCPHLVNLQGQSLPEIAVVGRSNVGKSSLLNLLFRRKNLVKTSCTPGKTQLINFFAIPNQVCFVDLPGYGFANVPAKIRAQWGPMVQNYLEQREPLKLILLLFDIRRMPNDDDFQMLQWILHSGKPAILVLTKIDTIGKSVCARNTAAILRALNIEADVVHFSVPNNQGRKELLAAIRDLLETSEQYPEENDGTP